MNKKTYILLFLFTCIMGQVNAQKKNAAVDSVYLQFSGLVLTSDSIYPIPYVAVVNKNKGVYTDFNGFFSFAAKKGDTIKFRHIQFKEVEYVIPDTLTGFKYNIVQLMTQDTINLPVTVIRALPNRRVFDKLFVSKEVPDDKIERARKNLEKEALKDRADKMDPSAKENYRNYVHQESKKLYYAGQMPPNNLLNPFAWAEFFNAWSRGDFKNKDKKK